MRNILKEKRFWNYEEIVRGFAFGYAECAETLFADG